MGNMFKNQSTFSAAIFIAVFVSGFSINSAAEEALMKKRSQEVNRTLDRFHQAAADADAKTYFGLFSENGVFIGTDASERWTKAEFQAYAAPHFSKGKGWTYSPKSRHVGVSPKGDYGWFDEILENKHYGTCRGSGVLVWEKDGWKISQYHLTIPIPNALAKNVVSLIRDQTQDSKAKSP
jgi:ketosteroid isomerase-like protein